jgi:hypothetical protein
MKKKGVVDIDAAKTALAAVPPRKVVQGWLDKYPTLAQEIRDANATCRTRPSLAKAVIEIVQRHTKKLYRQPMNYVNLTHHALGAEAFAERFGESYMGPFLERQLEKLLAKA